MKKSFAILLLTIYLFNVVGYKLVFSLLETKADATIIASLDKHHYKESELVKISVALNIPYLINNKISERCDGQIELNGIQYNYVKRMVQNDTLYLYCIPNTEKTDISNSKNLFAKQNADNNSGKSSEQSALKKVSFLSDYSYGALAFNFDAHKIQSNQQNSFNNLATLKGFTTKHLQPPDLFI